MMTLASTASMQPHCFVARHNKRIYKQCKTSLLCVIIEFSCSTCHKDADCIANSYCYCKSRYVGNGKYCCPEGSSYCQNGAIGCMVFFVSPLSNTGMRSLVTITKAAAYFRCDSGFNVSFSTVTWYKDGTPISSFLNRYGLANDGMLLYIENLTTADMGEYACQVHSAGTTFKRYGNLEVLEVGKTNLGSSACCK